MKLSNESKQALYTSGIPEYMHGGIIRYYEKHIEPGDFLTAVIDNDLKEACGRADDTNRHHLFDYMMWFYNHAPGGTWGRQGATHDWLMKGADDERGASY